MRKRDREERDCVCENEIYFVAEDQGKGRMVLVVYVIWRIKMLISIIKKKPSLITDTLINNLYGGHMIEQMMSYTVGLCYTIDCTPSKEPK